ncbi:hypothetical protein ACPPVS_12435 [Cellulomonas sp. McL0617]|uniref:hypothetical protein n=1 Tax=Cellulomonas sp. McL0617 TaxID=3415675 RepID=UPI003CF1CE83
MRDARGREWLSQSTRDGIRTGLPFGEAEMAGWDECAPTIDACTVDGRELPDHGDAWDVAWDVVHDAAGTALVTYGASWPYELRRAASATTDGGIRLTYTARATDRPVPFLWAAHPQLAAVPGTRIELSPTPAAFVDVLDPARPRVPWRPDLLTLADVPAGAWRKLYVDPAERVSSATLVQPDGSRLRFAWSPECRYLGLWFDDGAYAEHPVIAIEPTLGFADSLAAAADLGTCPLLSPGTPLRWWVEVHAVD